MKRSVDRILTTHAGSLPRPPELRAAHVARSRGEAFDAAALEAAIEKATRDVVAKQIEVGLDVVNNGEMGRESFFTYVQHRMSGFGGQSSRAMMADLVRYPGFLQRMSRETGVGESVTLMNAPQAVQAVSYTDDGPIRAEPFNRILNEMENETAVAETAEAMRKTFTLIGITSS